MGFTAESKPGKRYLLLIAVLVRTGKFCPAGPVVQEIRSGWEHSSLNLYHGCLRGSGTEETSRTAVMGSR